MNGVWIYNQDRTELVFTTRVQAEGCNVFVFNGSTNEDWLRMGIYESDEMAKEVLKQIVSHIRNQVTCPTDVDTVIYFMPQI